jgi:hypothetical protein
MATMFLTSSSPDAFGADQVIYVNGFEAKPGSAFPEWSSSKVTYNSDLLPPWSGSVDAPAVTNAESPNRKRRFLGEFGGPRLDRTARTRVRQTIRLKLDKLPRHTKATVRFDLLILKSWDGSSPQYGPDRWALKVVGGPTLLETTFSNNPKVTTDKSFQDYPKPLSRPQQGAAAVQALGYKFFGDSTYKLSFTFPHAAESLVLEFSSDLYEGKGAEDESWGLDDVTVSVEDEGGPAQAPPANQPSAEGGKR